VDLIWLFNDDWQFKQTLSYNLADGCNLVQTAGEIKQAEKK